MIFGKDNSDTTPGEAALMKEPTAFTPASAALRLSASVAAACASRKLTAALQAGVLRRERPGSPNTRFSSRGNSERSW
jgi:hypothetical protein